jgi:phage terminase small subunit
VSTETRLTPKQERFVAEYLIDLNATQAAIRAGYSKNGADVTGSRMLVNPKVSQAIQAAQKLRGEKLGIDSAWVLKQWVEIATADPNDVIQYRRVPCSSCWPSVVEKVKLDTINPDCPACAGQGRGIVHVNDTRNLKGSVRKLYAGVKLGKDGLQVLMRDQDAALLNIARHLGMFKETFDVNIKDVGAMLDSRLSRVRNAGDV